MSKSCLAGNDGLSALSVSGGVPDVQVEQIINSNWRIHDSSNSVSISS